MISYWFRYVLAFAFLTVFQVVILNNLHLSIYINPYVYILVILLLPFSTPGWIILSIAFFTGMTMDAFSNTMGMHSAAAVLIAFLREYLLKLMAPRDGYESLHSPHYSHMGLVWFLIYAGILTFILHYVLFLLEDFSFENVFSLLFKSILSTILSLIIMVILLLVSYKPRR